MCARTYILPNKVLTKWKIVKKLGVNFISLENTYIRVLFSTIDNTNMAACKLWGRSKNSAIINALA